MSKSFIRAIIIEDDPFTSQDLSEILQNHGLEVLKVYNNAEDCLAEQFRFSADILLVDIKLKGELSGIEMMNCILKKQDIPFILISANSDSETVNLAIEENPDAFITKPFDEKDVCIAVDLALKRKLELEESLLANHIFVKSGAYYEKVELDDIIYVSADGSYSTIHTRHRDFILSKNLNYFHNQMKKKLFIRVHRSFLVNRLHITGFDNTSVFLNEEKIPIGRSYRLSVKQKFPSIS